MDAQFQFQKDATVLSANGQQLGSLQRLVVNPGSKALTDMVVRTNDLLEFEERVVPIELVAETTEDQIVLREEAGDLSAFPTFEEERLIDEHGDTEPDLQTEDIPPVLLGAPGPSVVAKPLSEDRIVTRTKQNIPDGTVALKEGARVISGDGKHIGHVERVITDTSLEQVTELIISSGLLWKEIRRIPAKWVLTFGEDSVHLRVGKEAVDELKEEPVQ